MSPTIIVEKDGLLPSTISYHANHDAFSTLRKVLLISLSFACTLAVLSYSRGNLEVPTLADLAESCPQPPPLEPTQNGELWRTLVDTYKTSEFVTRAANWLGGAVRVRTESFDRMGPVGTDPRWEAFGPFHSYLNSAFPNVHSTLALTKVNTYGLVYEWTGTNSTSKPILLTAHQDVVPVNPDTLSEWTHPPYSGHFDGRAIWGRGSSDDKNGLIGLLSAIETLIENGFEPARTVVLAFGFDEETSGIYGASKLGEYLEANYGKKAFALLVDEGGEYMNEYGQAFATPGIAEKGYLDVRVEVESPGGHSSVPPPHTTIGILSAILVQYENNPYTPVLGRGTPMYHKALCLAAHAPKLPPSLRDALLKADTSDDALRAAEQILFQDRFFKSLVQTTQAIDLIQGGVKTNALPESAWAVVNHRIATDSSLDEVQKHDTALLTDIAKMFNLTYSAFGKEITDPDVKSYGKLVLSDAWGAGLQPAPVTPTRRDAAPFRLLAGTIKAVHNIHRDLSGNSNGVVVSPGIMSGNTDTRYYWDLTDHIFRYAHHFTGNASIVRGRNIHTINEFIEADAFIEMIEFYVTLLLNADELISL